MKKTYVTPSLDVIEINVTNILAASTINVFEEEVDPQEQKGRESIDFGSIWDQGW